MLQFFPDTIAEELDQPLAQFDALISRIDVELCLENRKLESRLLSVQRTRLLLDRINEAVSILKRMNDGGLMYSTIYRTYMAPERMKHDELIMALGISSRKYYRVRQEALSMISIRLWSAPTADVAGWLELMEMLESR